MSYKNIFWVVIAIVLFSSQGRGQHLIGIKGGYNLSKIGVINNDGFRDKKPKYRGGNLGGLMYRYYNDRKWGLQAEVQYSQRGWNETPDTLTTMTQSKYEIDYIEAVFMSHAYLSATDFRFYINIGPYFGYAISGESTVIDLNTNAKQVKEYNFVEDRDNRLDYGVTGGAGLEYFSNRSCFSAEFRYGYGFSDFDKVKTIESETSQSRFLSFSFSYGYYFGDLSRKKYKK